MLATFALGPQIKLKNMPSQFAMELAFGYHLSGEPTGPMVGAVLTPAFGNGVVTFGLLARFAWGFRPFSTLSFIVAPFVEAGWQHAAHDLCDFNGNCRSEGDGAFDLGFGVDARVTIAGRWVAFVRPASFGIYFSSQTSARYGLLFGGGASF